MRVIYNCKQEDVVCKKKKEIELGKQLARTVISEFKHGPHCPKMWRSLCYLQLWWLAPMCFQAFWCDIHRVSFLLCIDYTQQACFGYIPCKLPPELAGCLALCRPACQELSRKLLFLVKPIPKRQLVSRAKDFFTWRFSSNFFYHCLVFTLTSRL